jgi:three-Cys-motif partner protein
MPKVDFQLYEGGREQAYVKHCLLEDYLAQLTYKVGYAWDSIIYIDGFAGPWGTKDHEFADTSFGIAVRVLKNAVQGLLEKRGKVTRALCIFVEKKPDAFLKLDAFAKSVSTETFRAVALKGRFIEKLQEIEKLATSAGDNPFKFVFLDQKGWAAAPISELRPFVKERSCEVLFNLMTSFLTRFVDTETRADSYLNLFGRPGVLEEIRKLPKGTGEREEAAVRAYCKSLREICGFRYVSEAVILDPQKEQVRYYLIFATNHPKGIIVFKNAELRAARLQDTVRHDAHVKKTGQDFLDFGDSTFPSSLALKLRSRYVRKARQKIAFLLKRAGTREIPYERLFCDAMSFALVSPDDLLSWLDKWHPDVKFKLSGSGKRKKPSPDEEDFVIVTNPAAFNHT